MSQIDKSLISYDDKIINQEKKVIKYAIISLIVFLAISIILTIIFPSIYALIIGIVIGGVFSIGLFHVLGKRISETYYGSLKKEVNKYHLIASFIYIIVFASMAIIFKNIYGVIGALLGFLSIKIGIIIKTIVNK